MKDDIMIKQDIIKKRKEIRKKYYSTSGLFVATILGSLGLLFIYLTGIFEVTTYDECFQIFSKNGIIIIFGIFFLFITLYCWFSFIINVLIKPKKEILLLIDNHTFINKKGKIFYIDNCDKKINKYYYVLKTPNYIYEILEEYSGNIKNFSLKEKKSYWLNFYSPIGNFENLFLLPIVYVILIPGILSFIMSKGEQKIFGIIFSIVPIYIIMYDLIYKIKLKKSSNNEVDDTNLLKSYLTLKNILAIIFALGICLFVINLYVKMSDLKSKIIFLPFLLCTINGIGYMLVKIFNKQKLQNIFLKSYVIIFLIFWFAFLIFLTIKIIEVKAYIMCLFTIPFWIAGIYVFYKFVIKNK